MTEPGVVSLPDARALALDAAVGQLICPTALHPRRPWDGAAFEAELTRYGWGGCVVFHADRDTATREIARLQAASRIPLLVAADMEHGAGQQIAGASTFPVAMAFGAAGNPDHAYALGVHTAAEALEVGVNWLFAPVADVTNNPANPIINVRSFGGSPLAVGDLVAAFVKGAQATGALACAKHFPGHGDTGIDSHSRLAAVPADRARLEAIELPPFRAAMAADVASIMTAHLALPALGVHEPATVSAAVITGLLRQELGYDGLVVTDALVMGGVTGTLDACEAGVRAIAAGCDMLLMPPDPAALHARLLAAVHEGRLPEARVREAAARVLAAKARLQVPPACRATLPAAELARTVAREAVTLARGEAALPLPPDALVVAVDDGLEPARLAGWQAVLSRHGLAGQVVGPDTPEATWQELGRLSAAAPLVLVALFSPIRIHKDRSLLDAALLARLHALAAPERTIVLSCSSPFLVSQFPRARAWVLCYGTREVQLEAAVAALLAGGPYPGRLPVSLPDVLEGPQDVSSVPGLDGPSFM